MRVLSKLQSVMINESIMAHDYRFQFFWCCDAIFRIFILPKPINMKRYRSGMLSVTTFTDVLTLGMQF